VEREEIKGAYAWPTQLTAGTGQTIVIVDAFDEDRKPHRMLGAEDYAKQHPHYASKLDHGANVELKSESQLD
jgi:hypothetical protein